MSGRVAAAVAVLTIAACGTAAEPPRHIAVTATSTTHVNRLPDMTAPPSTVAPKPAVRPTVPRKPSRAAAPTPRPQLAAGDVWAALARCESGGNPRAVSSSGKYRGAFQFSLATWRSMGTGYADPIDAPYSVQLAAAQRLQARSGWGQWPTCARKLGLL